MASSTASATVELGQPASMQVEIVSGAARIASMFVRILYMSCTTPGSRECN